MELKDGVILIFFLMRMVKYFIEQIETDKEILPNWDDEEIIEHICNNISDSMLICDMQQGMVKL